MKLQIFRKHDKFPDGKEYLLDMENEEKPAQFDNLEDILNLFKSEHVGIETQEDLIRWGINIEEVE
jgi:hypothetical protein|tara:strand:+ start:346 stop:543 length:198 start_codon:yes stop_codon:yes gene_type:complete